MTTIKSYRIKNELLSKIDKQMVKEERTATWIVNKAIEEYLKKQLKK